MNVSLTFDPSKIPETISILFNFIKENPILCSILFLYYVLFYVYSFIHNKSVDSDIYEMDVLSNGISSIMIALLLVGLDETSKGFSFASIDLSSPTTKIALLLFIYGLILVVFAFTKLLPKVLVIILGNSEVDLFINFIAILLVDPNIVITLTMFFVIGAPLLVLLIIQRIRRLMG